MILANGRFEKFIPGIRKFEDIEYHYSDIEDPITEEVTGIKFDRINDNKGRVVNGITPDIKYPEIEYIIAPSFKQKIIYKNLKENDYYEWKNNNKVYDEDKIVQFLKNFKKV